MKSGFTFFIFLFLFSLTGYGQYTKSSNRKDMKEDTLTWKATVVKITFVNKAGKTKEGMDELYLRKNNKDYFIKFSGGKVLRSELEKYIDQEITVELLLKKGNLDTEEGNTWQQSRVGEYVVLFSIES